MQFLQTQRLLSAKQWLHDSPMSVAQVAQASGFGSSRRMYAAFAQHYRLSPGQLRRPGHKRAPDPHQGTTVVLHYRPPCQIAPLWRFFKDRALENMEMWDGEGPHAVLRKTVRWVRGHHTLLGWLQAHWHPTQPQLHLCVSPSLVTVLPDLVAQVRHWLDLDAEPVRIAQVIGHDFPEALGQRLPGCLDGFELAVRAVLGQQISVKAARTLGQRLVNALGEPCQTPWPELNKTFPNPMCLAQENIAPLLGSLGLVRQRQQAIRALAQAVASGALQLNPTTRPEPTLQALMALPGIGPWTAHYIAMRALHWQNAWPVQDVALQNALRVRQHPHPAQALEQLGQAWQPFRSYALMAAWEHGTSPPELHT